MDYPISLSEIESVERIKLATLEVAGDAPEGLLGVLHNSVCHRYFFLFPLGEA